jgi:hypothetical protein
MTIYDAGMDCRSVEAGVIGDRKEMMTSRGSILTYGAGILYVRFVQEASNLAPIYLG